MNHTLVLQEISPITPDIYRLLFPKPDGFHFNPGQATELALDQDGWREEGRPFTFTSLPSDESLEFTIKTYPSRNGVTTRIAGMLPGDQVLIGDAWGGDRGRGCRHLHCRRRRSDAVHCDPAQSLENTRHT